MKNRFRQLGKDSLIYGIGGAISKGVGLFLLPVYTRIFSPSEYGSIEIVSTFCGFLLASLILGTDSAQSFYFFKEKHNGPSAQAKIITSIFQWRMIWGGGILFLGISAVPLFNGLFFKNTLSFVLFFIAFSSTYFAQLAGQSIELYRLTYRPWPFIIINSLSVIFSAAVTILLVYLLKLGIICFFIGLLSSWILCAVIGWIGLRQYLDFSRLHFDIWPKILKFSIPMVPASMSIWVIGAIDRWFLNYNYSSGVVGTYAVAAKFALFISFAVEIFRLAWLPISLDVMHAPEGPGVFRIISRYYSGFGMIGVVILTALSPKLFQWLTVPAYYSAYPVVGPLAFSSVFFGFYLISTAGSWKAEKTWLVTIALIIAALSDVIFNALLVPAYAGMGAAIASALAMFIGNAVLLFISEKHWPIKLNYKIIAAQIIIAIISVFGILTVYSLHKPIWEVVLITVISVLAIIFLTAGENDLKKVSNL